MSIRVEKFVTQQFDQNKLEATRVAWDSTAEDLGLPALEYEKTMAWVSTHIRYDAQHGESYAYGIFEEGKDEAVAVVDLVHSRRVRDVGVIKMLEVTMGPSLAPSQITAENYPDLVSIYGQAVVGVIALSQAHPARIIKIYGRDNDLMSLLFGLNVQFNSQNTVPIKSKIEGRWLVITVN